MARQNPPDRQLRFDRLSVLEKRIDVALRHIARLSALADGLPMCHVRLISIALACLLAGCATPAAEVAVTAPTAPASSASVGAGRDIAQANCSSCHAIGTEGNSPNPASPPFRTLSGRYPIETLAESFAEGIFVGHPVMPEFRLETKAVDDLIAYIASVQPAERPAS
jgi:cytochrome c